MYWGSSWGSREVFQPKMPYCALSLLLLLLLLILLLLLLLSLLLLLLLLLSLPSFVELHLRENELLNNSPLPVRNKHNFFWVTLQHLDRLVDDFHSWMGHQRFTARDFEIRNWKKINKSLAFLNLPLHFASAQSLGTFGKPHANTWYSHRNKNSTESKEVNNWSTWLSITFSSLISWLPLVAIPWHPSIILNNA